MIKVIIILCLNISKGGGRMERDRRARVIAVVALLVGVVGLSLGFAAITNTLTIKSSAEVKVDASKFNVDFSTASATVTAGNVTPTLNPSSGAPAAFTGSTATIDNSSAGAPVIQNLHATFTEPGQSVTYSFYTKNAGELAAYLTGVTFNETTSGSGVTKACTAKSGTTQALVNQACTGISLTLTLGSESFTSSTTRANFTSATAHDLAVGASGYEAVTVVIAYASGSAQADGDFDVAFGDITLDYSSVA